MRYGVHRSAARYGRPPHGGRGLKLKGLQLNAISKSGRPPHGGRGLKFLRANLLPRKYTVALPTEGVD